MKEAGFCERHGSRAQLGKPLLPPELLAVSQAVMPQIVLRLIQHLRSHRYRVLHQANKIYIYKYINHF